MFRVDMKDFERARLALDVFARSAVPYAARAALTSEAFEARKAWHAEMSAKFTLRNQYTQRSVRVEKARGLNLRTMQSRVGTVAPYMPAQEDSAVFTGAGKHGRPIPTDAARVGRSGAKLVARASKLSRITLKNPKVRAIRNRRQRAAAQIKMARASGSKHVFLDLKSKGIFRVMGTKKKPKLRMLWDMSHRSVRIPKTPTLGPALKVVEGKALGIAHRALVYQLRRRHILGF